MTSHHSRNAVDYVLGRGGETEREDKQDVSHIKMPARSKRKIGSG